MSPMFSVPCFVFALPVKNAILSISPPPFCLTEKTQEKKTRGEWRPFSILILFQWLGKVAGLAACPWPSSMLQHIPPLALSLRFFSLFPNGNRKRVPFIFIVLALAFYVTGKRTRENKDKRGKMKTSTIFSLPWVRNGCPFGSFSASSSEKKGRTFSFKRDRGEMMGLEECHLLCALFSPSLSLLPVSSIPCSTLPEKRHPCDLSSLTSFSLLSIYYLLTD